MKNDMIDKYFSCTYVLSSQWDGTLKNISFWLFKLYRPHTLHFKPVTNGMCSCVTIHQHHSHTPRIFTLCSWQMEKCYNI